MHETILQCINIDHNRLWLQSIINKPSHRTTFLQSRLASSVPLQTSYFFLWYFLFGCTLYKYEFFKIFIAW